MSFKKIEPYSVKRKKQLKKIFNTNFTTHALLHDACLFRCQPHHIDLHLSFELQLMVSSPSLLSPLLNRHQFPPLSISHYLLQNFIDHIFLIRKRIFIINFKHVVILIAKNKKSKIIFTCKNLGIIMMLFPSQPVQPILSIVQFSKHCLHILLIKSMPQSKECETWTNKLGQLIFFILYIPIRIMLN